MLWFFDSGPRYQNLKREIIPLIAITTPSGTALLFITTKQSYWEISMGTRFPGMGFTGRSQSRYVKGFWKERVRNTQSVASIVNQRLRQELLERCQGSSFRLERTAGIQKFIITWYFFSSGFWVTGCLHSHVLVSVFWTQTLLTCHSLSTTPLLSSSN